VGRARATLFAREILLGWDGEVNEPLFCWQVRREMISVHQRGCARRSRGQLALGALCTESESART
jgi:hypothetical protein